MAHDVKEGYQLPILGSIVIFFVFGFTCNIFFDEREVFDRIRELDPKVLTIVKTDRNFFKKSTLQVLKNEKEIVTYEIDSNILLDFTVTKRN